MEFGDIIYLLLMFAFIVFGIFNDSKKKKKKVSESTQPVNREEEFRDVIREIFQKPQKQSVPPPTPKTVKRKTQVVTPSFSSAKSTHREFQSSLDLVTDFEGESSLKGSMFASELFENQKEMKVTETLHPILKQLRSKDGQSEIRKAVIYSEILNRKY
ncbi:MAG: hypothetical protein ACOYEG_02645 [Petrimonas sp.]|jgi:hypothetical protein|nr:MAG: hypothetical protein BWZ00_01119 [Bacteroidetes bacterium ADurb.BinA174]